MDKKTKESAVRGMCWAAVDRFGSQFIGFFINLLLARLLLPSDYGVVAVLSIFLALASTFLDCGFANALIQKKDRDDVDFSTVFIFNLTVSFLIYGLFYIAAPYIASFFKVPCLVQVTRVVALNFIVNGLSIVQTAKLTVELNFRALSGVSLTALTTSGLIGIMLAYKGYAYWSLVWQGFSFSIVRMFGLWIIGKWKPSLKFSPKSFKRLFSFGSGLLLSGLIHTIYSNIHSLIIGRIFSIQDLGFYNRGAQFAQMPSEVLSSVVIKVNYPILASLQDDNVKLLEVYSKLLRTPMFLLFPAVLGLAAIAEPMVCVLIGEKWLPCCIYLQILAFCFICDPMTRVNLNLLYVKGRSDIVLKLEIVKKTIAFVIMIATIPFGIVPFCFGSVFYSIIALYLNCIYTKRLVQFGFAKQILQVLPILINCVIMVAIVRVSILFFSEPLVKLFVGVGAGATSYLFIAWLMKDPSMLSLIRMIPKVTRPGLR